jgi:mannitol/fructose-specific phosphotransferase system IIA component
MIHFLVSIAKGLENHLYTLTQLLSILQGADNVQCLRDITSVRKRSNEDAARFLNQQQMQIETHDAATVSE